MHQTPERPLLEGLSSRYQDMLRSTMRLTILHPFFDQVIFQGFYLLGSKNMFMVTVKKIG